MAPHPRWMRPPPPGPGPRLPGITPALPGLDAPSPALSATPPHSPADVSLNPSWNINLNTAFQTHREQTQACEQHDPRHAECRAPPPSPLPGPPARGPLSLRLIHGRGSECSLTWCCAGGFMPWATPTPRAPVVWLGLSVLSDLCGVAQRLPPGVPWSMGLPSLLRSSPLEREAGVGRTWGRRVPARAAPSEASPSAWSRALQLSPGTVQAANRREGGRRGGPK